MKSLFKSKPKTPAELVRQTRDLLIYADRKPDSRETKREEKMEELSKLIQELKSILYGNSESEPVSEACAQLTQEFFRENTLRLLIIYLPKLNLEARKDATQVVANLQRQQVHSRLIASDYLEANIDLLDVLMAGYEDADLALHFGAMLREFIRHQSIASVSSVVSEALEKEDDGNVSGVFDQYFVPLSLIERSGSAMDIVYPDSKRCRCFTKSYYRHVKGAGSLLATRQLENKGKACSLQEQCLRYFTPKEVANLHSFPEDFQFPHHINLRQRYALLGNSLSVAVVAPLIRYLFTEPH